ncbi:hypothetical protein KP509_29G035900 [Ceratopteris richardii]|uniref:C2 domain-containing protein n=1 Tax=Ceratopteris richardii TaxID=49495 RepID=A0A8T2R6Z8_CERRI|nr:hypothetical protein KP509_29G035900 [Ceratopteris richardii]
MAAEDEGGKVGGWVELIIHSAENLKDVRTLEKMQTYVEASVERSGRTYSQNEAAEKALTPVDRRGGRNPKWEHTLRLHFTCHSLAQLSSSSFLLLRILALPSAAALSASPTRVGSVLLPFSHISCQLHPGSDVPICLTDTWQRSTARVQRPSGRYQGFLTFSVRLRLQGDGEGAPPVPQSLRPSTSRLRSQLSNSNNHFDPTAPLSFAPSHAPDAFNDSGSMAGAVLAAALAMESCDIAGDF